MFSEDQIEAQKMEEPWNEHADQTLTFFVELLVHLVFVLFQA